MGRFVGVTASPFVHRLRVRYHECDMQGIVFNSHYYAWIDIAHQADPRGARPARRTPLSGGRRDGRGVLGRYLASARFDQEIDIEVTLAGLTTTSMTTLHTFRHGDTVLAEGRVRHVCVDRGWPGKRPWPDEVRAAFTPLLPASG